MPRNLGNSNRTAEGSRHNPCAIDFTVAVSYSLSGFFDLPLSTSWSSSTLLQQSCFVHESSAYSAASEHFIVMTRQSRFVACLELYQQAISHNSARERSHRFSICLYKVGIKPFFASQFKLISCQQSIPQVASERIQFLLGLTYKTSSCSSAQYGLPICFIWRTSSSSRTYQGDPLQRRDCCHAATPRAPLRPAGESPGYGSIFPHQTSLEDGRALWTHLQVETPKGDGDSQRPEVCR